MSKPESNSNNCQRCGGIHFGSLCCPYLDEATCLNCGQSIPAEEGNQFDVHPGSKFDDLGRVYQDKPIIETTSGMFISIDRYNDLSQKEQDLLKFRRRSLLATRAIYRLTGISDFDEITRKLESEDDAFYVGIPLPITDEEKAWMIPAAHARNMSLGDWVREIFSEAINKFKERTASGSGTPASGAGTQTAEVNDQ